ncbi:bifunctional riboflavin kinase/FAD synthetase, partial [Bordetella hinzii]|nr:bifunctional riboflavin kinase/FAD synthetase [Bordetella hinzii]
MKPSLRIYHHLPPAGQRSPCALTIGNFDGVHRGHQAILARVRETAQTRGLTPSVMTFEPHPREYFAQLHQRPELAPTRISGLRDKVASLARAGMEQVLIEPFDARLAEMSANAFIEDLLVTGL